VERRVRLAQQELGIPRGSIRANGSDRDDPRRFRDGRDPLRAARSFAGLNCGRWDYIFSLIKKLGSIRSSCCRPRSVTMTTPFMRAYSLLTIKTCHRRGIHAMGGMAAQIPIKNDSAANDAALAAVRADKKRESDDGHDGTWVAHPGLVAVAKEQFARIGGDEQIHVSRAEVNISAAQLLTVPAHPQISETGVRRNISVGIRYLESWLRGQGCVPINNSWKTPPPRKSREHNFGNGCITACGRMTGKSSHPRSLTTF
jgi:malate synthase